jgi:ABC-type nickel/cobalt efflux system permease component RcnA
MALINILLMGFLIGLKHALEADHVAAVASLASKTTSAREGLALGATWGLGHTITLFAFSSMVLIVDTVISAQLALALEFFVGCMLVIMGGAIVKEIVSKRIHLHVHEHSDGTTHLHFHSHALDRDEHQSNTHQHTHQLSIRALLVGMMHGMAGSAALIVLTLDSAPTIETRLVYIFLFGAGSILGMALLSYMIIIPLQHSENFANHTYQSLQIIIGLVTLFLGINIMYETSVTNGLLV